jgi:hypothetical protein
VTGRGKRRSPPKLSSVARVQAPAVKRTLASACLIALLALPAGAQANVIELGAGAPPAKVSCPNSCQAIGQVTGYQGRAGAGSNPFVVPTAGKIVAFTVTLGRPDARQQRFFNNLYGGPPKVRLSILRRGKRRSTRLNHRLMDQSRAFRVDRYLGSSPTFALGRPLVVRRGYIVALTAPTWAPAFAVGLPRSNWWRSSRRKTNCQNVSQRAAQETLRSVKVYGCTYFRARLLYSATFIPDPQPTG